MIYRGVVMPAKPPIDKVAALAVLEMFQETPVEQISFWDKPTCSAEQLAAWRAEGTFPIDLENEKYSKGSSATEVVARQLHKTGIPDSVIALVAETNKNNGDGSLKGQPLSIALTIRDAYDLKDDDGWAEELVRRGVDVVKVWLQVWTGCQQYGQYSGVISAAEKAVLDKELPELLSQMREQLGGKKELKLGFSTLLQYLRDLWRAKRDKGEIEEKVGFWLQAKTKIQRLMNQYGPIIRNIEAGNYSDLIHRDERVFSIPGGGLRALALIAPHPILVKLATQSCKWAVVVVKEADGRGCILTKNLDVSRLISKLQEMEPGRWHDSGHGVVMNGGRIYKGIPPTGHDMMFLQYLVQEHPPQRRN